MTVGDSLDIVVYGANASVWHVHGTDAGAEGVWLAKDQVEGVFEAPLRQSWDANARQIGGSLKGQWNDVRDLALGFHCVPTASKKVEQVEDEFRSAFVYREDEWDWNAVLPRIAVTSPRTPTRSLDVQMYSEPDFNPGLDPLVTEFATPIVKLRAGQPFWYAANVLSSWSTAAASGSGTVTVSNPSSLPMHAKWVMTRGQWTLPDRSWSGPPNARVVGRDKMTGRDDSARTILLPNITSAHGGATVDLAWLTGAELMIRDASNQTMLGQMPVPGQYFSHVFPSQLQSVTVPVSVTGAPAGGAMVQLIQPRLYSRPIGGA